MIDRRMRRLLVWGSVLLFTGGLYALAPFGPDLQTALLARLGPVAYVLIPVPFVLAASVLLVQTIRRRPGRIFSTLVAFAAFGVLYASCLRLLERPIEQIHFLLYGALSGIVFWALSTEIVGWVLYPWTLIVVSLIGMGDELIQWWLPNRVADFHDVLFDALGGALGLAFLGLGMRPRAARGPLRPRQAQCLAGGIVVLAIAAGTFITSVHEFGYEIRDPEIGTFLSLFSSDDLDGLNRARLAAVSDGPLRDPRLRRFDMEARRHLRLQEKHLKEGRWGESASERAILERYYVAYLSVPGRLPDPGPASPAAPAPPATFQSEAYQGRIFTGFGPSAVWSSVGAVILMALAGSAGLLLRSGTQRTPSSASGAAQGRAWTSRGLR